MDSSAARERKARPHKDRRATASYTLRGCVLLEWRLTSLGLNPKGIERVSPEVLARLRSTCSTCSNKQRCLDDMLEHFNAAGWQQYCPNSETLSLLSARKGPSTSIK
jgi:hypothetical protein